MRRVLLFASAIFLPSLLNAGPIGPGQIVTTVSAGSGISVSTTAPFAYVITATGGGSSASNVAVSSGSATNSVVISSAVTNIIVDSNTFIASLQGSTSVYIRLSGSSVTLQGIVTTTSLGALSTSSATATYLQLSSATLTYLNQLSAANIYLSQSSATATYLQLSSATSTYLPIATAASTYLTQSSATTTYLQLSSASVTYLNQLTAASTYLTQSSATATYFNKSAILPVANGGTGTATPAITPGTNITSVTGTWPNVTINAATQSGTPVTPLAVSSGSATNSVVVSSPTYKIITDSNTIITSLQGSTSAFIQLNPSSVTLQGIVTAGTLGALTTSSATATYLQLSSASATYLQLSSATATYLQQSSATATYLQLSSATATYLNKLSYTSSGTVNQGTKGYVAYYNVTGTTVAPNSSLQFGTNVSSFTTPVDMGSHQIHSVTDPTSAQDAMTLNYFNSHFPQTPNTASYEDFSSVNITGPGYTDTGYGVTITASSSTAPILITVNGTLNNTGANNVYIALFRDAVELCDTNKCAVSDPLGFDFSTSFSIIDVPGDTSPHLYEVFMTTFGLGINGTYNAVGIESSVYAQEIR